MGNLFTNFDAEFKNLSENQLVDKAIESFRNFAAPMLDVMGDTGNDLQLLGTLFYISALLTVPNDLPLSSKRKSMIQKVGDKFGISIDAENLDNATGGDDDDWEGIRQWVTSMTPLALDILRFILCFAHIDGDLDSEAAAKLEGIFSFALIADFGRSGMESVPKPIAYINLNDIEIRILKWFQSDDSLYPLSDIQKKFSEVSKSQLTAALNHLSDLGLVYGGEHIIGNMYGLAVLPEEIASILSQGKKDTAQAPPPPPQRRRDILKEQQDSASRVLRERQRQREFERQEWEYERQERERERQERKDELHQRLERNAVHAEETAARREYLKPAQGILAASLDAYAFVKSNGTVDAFHHFCSYDGTPGDVSQFKDIKSVVCTSDGIVGLRYNGTCIATYPGKSCNSHIWEANQWSDIKELAAGGHHVVGLCSDGTCISSSIGENTGYGNYGQCNVSGWSDIVAIACGSFFTIGLKSDGTVVYTGHKDACGAENWKDIALIAAGGGGAVGVTRTGKVVSAGKVNIDAMERAENIIQLGVSLGNAYALQADGTLVGGRQANYTSTKKVVVEKNVLAMATGGSVLVLKEDGHVKRCGAGISNTDLPSNYRLFESYDGYMKERAASEEACRQHEQQQKAFRDAGVCQHCGGAFKRFLFSCKCNLCGRKKDY